jgi:HAD superfamily hydrolase (TIGR01509 family)
MMLPAAILFDADGTLYDSEEINYEANRRTAKQLHDFHITWETFNQEVRRGKKSGFMILEEVGIVVDRPVFLEHKLRHFQELVREQLVVQPGLAEFLMWCQKKNIRCAVVSASRRNQLLFALDVLQLTDYFEVIVSMEDIADRAKPDPYPYELGLQLLDLAPDNAVAIEDTPKGIASAQAAGLKCVAIRNSTNTAQEIQQADHCIEHYDEFKTYLSRH